MPYIECQDLFKIYKRAELEVVALRGVDLEVEAGEFIAIVGASGSGKSTLLNVLSGLDKPSAGQVQVGGRDLLNISDRELTLYRRLEVGFVWQATGRNLVPYLNVRDNVELPMAIAGLAVGARQSRSMELLSTLARIHRRTALGTVLEEASGCSSESGIMVLEQKPARKQGAPNRCCHRTNPTVSASSLTTIAWWPMQACSCRPP